MQAIAFTLFDYPLSWLELLATATGLVSVWLAYRNHIATWPIGIVSVIAFFWLFYEVALYSDMLLQVYFLFMSGYGWWYWQAGPEQPAPGDPARSGIRSLTPRSRIGLLLATGAMTLLLGLVMSRISAWLPLYFPQPAAYPYADGFTTAASVLATILLARRRLEAWVLWILVDLVSIVLYTLKDIRLVALEYVIFLVLATLGLLRWRALWLGRTASEKT